MTFANVTRRNHLGGTFDLAGNGDELGASRRIGDQGDYLQWRESLGRRLLDPQVNAVSVPEPATISLCGLGAILLMQWPSAKKALGV